MPQETPSSTPQAAPDREGWLDHLAAECEESGYLEPLGRRHWALFRDEGPVLLVSFDRFDEILARQPGDLPAVHRLAADQGWSHLSLLAEGATWYRDPKVWGFFDRLIDEGFFEDFDRVVFTGAGMGGYAACAFSVAAPGASVLALRPLATLDPGVAGWDHRHRAGRHLDFHSRFGYAPDMVAGQQQVFLLHDPEVREDAMHAALFRDPVVRRLDCRHIGPAPEAALAKAGLLAPLLQAAMAGQLTPTLWAQIWRGRRNYLPWLHNLAQASAKSGTPAREALLLRSVLARFPQSPRLRGRLDELAAQLTG